jgi:DNA-binding response OmpR family regulator
MLPRGHAVSRATLLESVWNMSPDAGTNVVDVYVNYLRRKLRDNRQENGGAGEEPAERSEAAPIIRTVRGMGYSIGQAV